MTYESKKMKNDNMTQMTRSSRMMNGGSAARRFFTAIILSLLPLFALAAKVNPESVVALVNRVCGPDAAPHFVFVLDEQWNEGKEGFQLSADGNKVRVTANTLSAMTAGLNWYLNHDARVNITWNNLRQRPKAYPAPSDGSIHTANTKYRYYLNYCTFSYSMAFWTWERWEKEIDWMALHGINAPLQLVGLDVTWQKTMLELGYSKAQVAKFVAGPGFQAWWGMVNLEGHGGPNPDWWYERQEKLAKKICDREYSLGFQPVLPGFAGQVPSPKVGQPAGMTLKTYDCGSWCGYKRPAMLSVTDTATYNTVAETYYRNLHKVMGQSVNYSMDCFHEGGRVPSGMTAKATYDAVYKAMDRYCGKGSRCFMQQWQWKPSQATAMTSFPQGRLVVLDLYSDVTKERGWKNFSQYKGHESVYCMLSNFGGRVGMHGNLRSMMKTFFTCKSKYNVKGIGATAEGIENNPILYDALYEMAWTDQVDVDSWLAEFVRCRYGADEDSSNQLLRAWKLIERSALNCTTGQTGPSEPIVCAHPSYSATKVSAWGTANIFYDTQSIIEAADIFLSMAGEVNGQNMEYDLTDCVRQAIVNYAKILLNNMKQANAVHDKDELAQLQKRFLMAIDDLDRLLTTRPDFSLYTWTQMARDITKEVGGTTEADREWLERQARMLLTTWRDNGGALTDYANRCWSGLLRDYYKPRWEKFFNGQAPSNWHTMEAAWRDNMSLQYTEPAVKENTYIVATAIFNKYFHRIASADGKAFYINAGIKTTSDKFSDQTNLSRDEYMPSIALPEDVEVVNRTISDTSEPTNKKVKIVLSDGTEFSYSLKIQENI